MVVVLGVLGVALLLDGGPATDVLKAPRGVPSLDQADGLHSGRRRNREKRDRGTGGTFNLLILSADHFANFPLQPRNEQLWLPTRATDSD